MGLKSARARIIPRFTRNKKGKEKIKIEKTKMNTSEQKVCRHGLTREICGDCDLELERRNSANCRHGFERRTGNCTACALTRQKRKDNKIHRAKTQNDDHMIAMIMAHERSQRFRCEQRVAECVAECVDEDPQ